MNSVFCCFFPRKILTTCSQNPGLVNQFSANPRGQLNWTGPIANGSERHPHKFSGFSWVSREGTNMSTPHRFMWKTTPHLIVSWPKESSLGSCFLPESPHSPAPPPPKKEPDTLSSCQCPTANDTGPNRPPKGEQGTKRATPTLPC